MKFDPFCLHWGCSPLTVQAALGGATPMQAKWIKLHLHMPAHDDREHVFICRISIILQVLIELGRLLFRRHLYTGTEFMIDH